MNEFELNRVLADGKRVEWSVSEENSKLKN
jgi:hypothetical protein